MAKNKILAEATDTKGTPIRVGDKVAFAAYLWDPLLCIGEITKIYASDEDSDESAKAWTTKCSVRDLSTGQIIPNVQIRRILKLQEQASPKKRGKQYQILRECKHGVDAIHPFVAESYEEAVKYAQIVALKALEEAYIDDPDEVWGSDVRICFGTWTNDIAWCIDPENINGYVRSDVYLSLSEVEGVEPATDPVEISEEDEALLKIARDADDLEQDLKLAFRLKKAGCTYAEISEAFHDEHSEFWTNALDVLAGNDAGISIYLYDSVTEFNQSSFVREDPSNLEFPHLSHLFTTGRFVFITN